MEHIEHIKEQSLPIALIITGPTGSGKSALALSLAHYWDVTIINADSMQVYRDLRILTARPSEEEEKSVPHRLYGVLPARQAGNVAWWRQKALDSLSEAWAAKRLPVLCGGTGLYIQALTHGLSFIPTCSHKIRQEARAFIAQEGAEALYTKLRDLDPKTAASLNPNDAQRISRAWEVLKATGKGLCWWQKQPGLPPAACRFIAIRLAPERPLLRDYITHRFATMLSKGVVEEVRALLKQGLETTLPIMRAHGVPELTAMLAGHITKDEATQRVITATCRYTKRQATWFSHHELTEKGLTKVVEACFSMNRQFQRIAFDSIISFITSHVAQRTAHLPCGFTPYLREDIMTDQQPSPVQTATLTGAEVLIRALVEQGVDVVFGYPGGAVLPIYDALFQQNHIRHILVRHEQAAVHAAEGYARSTGKVGVVLVTSGPGATNAVTGLLDALMDSVPLVCLSGQVPTSLIGNDAFQEADTTGITRPVTKHNYLVRKPEELAPIVHEAFAIARSGRPGPVLVDLPKNITVGPAPYVSACDITPRTSKVCLHPNRQAIARAVSAMKKAHRPLFYIGGGVINSGAHVSQTLRHFVDITGFPVTATLMGLGAFPGHDRRFLGMLGMHGTYEANLATHGCDVLVALGCRFDDRVTGRTNAFSPHSFKIHVDIDPSQINKIIHVDEGIVGDVGEALTMMIAEWQSQPDQMCQKDLAAWWEQIETWRAMDCLRFVQSQHFDAVIKPQHAIKRIYELSRALGRETYVTTEVGQHQMWAAQFFRFDEPGHFLTSGGLGTMGYGLPAAVGTQIAHPDALVIDIAGEASTLMNIQELGTISQYRLPVKVFIINNQYMGMVRQWQELLHGSRYSESYSAALPDFVQLAESFHVRGLCVTQLGELDSVLQEALEHKGPVMVDIRVAEGENCFPMIPSGAAHNEMLLGAEQEESEARVSSEGRVLV